jgi:hypothetical protein
MDQTKVEKFWQAVVDAGDALRALLDVSPGDFKAHEAFALTCELEEMLRSTVPDIDPLLSADLEQGDSGADKVLMIVITCNCNPAGIEPVQQFVATAPALPPCLRVCAFRPPVSRQTLRERSFRSAQGTIIPAEQVRFMVLPGTATDAAFDIACIVPPSCKTEMDPDKVPGAAAAYTVLIMGIGELRFMSRIRSLKVAVMETAPEEAVSAWELLEIIDRAPVQ